jgi:2,4-dichlorophenol 6-monooxygenase
VTTALPAPSAPGAPTLGVRTHVIGPPRAIEDHTGDWALAREIDDAGCLIVRPDHHVAWRSETLAADPAAELRRVFKSLLAR